MYEFIMYSHFAMFYNSIIIIAIDINFIITGGKPFKFYSQRRDRYNIYQYKYLVYDVCNKIIIKQ